MNFKFCGEYVIMDILPVGDKGAAMGINQTNGSFATWETATENRKGKEEVRWRKRYRKRCRLSVSAMTG